MGKHSFARAIGNGKVLMDLSTNYLGLQLKNPIVASASPLSREIDTARKLEDAGVSAIVVYSLFQEQIEHEQNAHDHFDGVGTDAHAESLSFLPGIDYAPRGPEEYLGHLRRLKEAIDIPVIASLNAATLGGWTEYAGSIRETGVDALELNVYHIATDPAHDAQAIEDEYLEVVKAIKRKVSLPVAVKLGSQFTSLPHFAKRLDQSGVDGLVLFNRFYHPDIDLENLDIVPNLVFSSPHEMHLALRWIAILDPIVDASIAATTGVYRGEDAIKLLMAGADVTMVCAALLCGGPQVATKILREMAEWMESHEYTGVDQMKGSLNHKTCPDPAGFERANYMRALLNYGQHV